MIPRYLALGERIALEIADIERTQQAILRHWQRMHTATIDQDAYINSVALNLHSFYSGLERIFELVVIQLDGGALGGTDWHAELIRQITLDLPEVRPAVIQRETAMRLDEYRKFRHRIRNIYATNLDPERMQFLITELHTLWPQIHQELNKFRTFLRELSHADEN